MRLSMVAVRIHNETAINIERVAELVRTFDYDELDIKVTHTGISPRMDRSLAYQSISDHDAEILIDYLIDLLDDESLPLPVTLSESIS